MSAPYNIVLRVDGTATQLERAPSIADIERLIGATTLDSVNLRDGRCMLLDDAGHARGLPRNEAATALYLSICRPGTKHFIAGDVVVVRDSDYARGDV